MSPDVATRCAGDGCENPMHDHFGGQESWANGHDEPWPYAVHDDRLRCEDCGVFAHYDRGDESYHHTPANAEPCFLVPELSPNRKDNHR